MNPTRVQNGNFYLLLFCIYFSFFAIATANTNATNPYLTGGCGRIISIQNGTTGSVDLDARGDNCDTLIWSMAPGEIAIFSGAFVDVGAHNVISAEFGTALGGVVNATRVDGK